jgi:hypothetical protein
VLIDKAATILTFGASYEPGDWFAMGEWTRVNTHSFVGIGTGWYASGGYRFGPLTPYLTYAKMKAAKTSDPGLRRHIVPPRGRADRKCFQKNAGHGQKTILY